MEHSTFVEKYRSRLLSVSVDREKAGFLYEDPHLIPQKLRLKQALLRAVVFGGIPIGFILFFFTPWWLATGVLVFGLAMSSLTQKSAAKGVLEASLSSPRVYETAVNNEVLHIRETT